MAGTTPIYGFPYQELGDPPHGPNLGKQLAEEVEVELQRVDARIVLADNVQVFTSGGTWNKPANAKTIRVRVQAGGGAGGGAPATGAGQQSGGAGGGGGGYAETFLQSGDAASSVAVTVGAAGTGVSGATGNSGGTSSFGSHASATGGSGGGVVAAGNTNASFIGSAGGAGTAGQVQCGGSGGGFVKREILDGAVLTITSGYGGNSVLGGGARPRESVGAGLAGTNYGGGGGGGLIAASSAAVAGGAGGAGIVIVETFV